MINESFNFQVDCYGTWFGDAFIDNCSECVEGLTGVSSGWAEDCNGDCFGASFIDDCGDCSGGNTGLEENYEDTLVNLASSKKEISHFFDNVIVNDKDNSIKKNRLELLQMLCKTFDNYLNFSNIEST